MNLTLVGTSRCDVPAREAAGGISAPLSVARTAQRAVPTRFRVQSAKISWNSSHEPARSLPALQRLMQFRFMGREQVRKEHGAFHEPQKVAQASCLFGADRLEACPTLQLAAPFKASTHVQFLEVFAFHEPTMRAKISRDSSSVAGSCIHSYRKDSMGSRLAALKAG